MLNTIMILEVKRRKLYDIFLDKQHRLYSCAYWKDGTKTLEDAQQNKIDHIAKKLSIKKGQKILEVGCGWGGMAFEIAKQKKLRSNRNFSQQKSNQLL